MCIRDRLMDMLEQQLGSHTEVVLHDLKKDYANTIVDIRNGHITGREVGGTGSNLGLEVLQGTVKDGNRFNSVSYTHLPDRKLIENFGLNVNPGQRVAIVGPTGCGKTTIINLLMRFYDVDSGSIKVEGTDIRNITRKSLRTNYGMVLQETWLKTETIR